LKSSTNIKDAIRNLVPKYRVRVHPKVDNFISSISELKRRNLARDLLDDLPNYPDVLDRWDIEKVKGRDNTYRARIGRYRIAFIVDKKSRQIDVPDATIK
jgi:mRNA-degrading endonuclease RelE of RelBE toxin-antitoxin system